MRRNQFNFLIMILAVIIGFGMVLTGCPNDPKPKNVTITFDSNGGTPNFDPITIRQGSSMGDLYPVPTRAAVAEPDWEFTGWYINVDEPTTEYTASTPVNSNINLVAGWSNIPIQITFNSDGGTPVASFSINKGSTMGVQYPADPDKDGFLFGGWFIDVNDSDTLYTSTTRIQSAITLTAKWLPAVTITFDSDGGTPATYESLKIEQGTRMLSSIPADPEKEGFAFGGWFDAETMTTEYTRSTIINSNINLKAKWNSPITVTFNPNNGDENIEIIIAENRGIGNQFWAPVKDGHSFAGWYDASDNKYTNLTIINSSITLTAKWETRISGTQVGQWSGFSIDTDNVEAEQYDNLLGKENVLYLKTSEAGWSIMNYLLPRGEVTITVSVDVYMEDLRAIGWQTTTTGYPVIAASGYELGDPVSPTGSWVTVTGTGTVTATSQWTYLYLSTGVTGPNAELYLANLSVVIDDGSLPKPVGLTIGDKKDLNPELTLSGTITWSSNASSIATVNSAGIVTAVGISDNGNTMVSSMYATGTATITASNGTNTQNFTITTTTAGQVDIMDLTPLKDSLSEHFLMVGNIARLQDAAVNGSAIINPALNYHFNTITAENDMKPQYLSNGRNATTGEISYTWTNSDRMVNAAIASGHLVIGHTLMWHGQIPQWQVQMANAEPAVARAAMIQFITDVCTRYAGKIHTWDVLNEIFPDGGYTATSDWKTVMRGNNPWYASIGPDFVYEGFLAARLADPEAILYYNDYNLNNVAKATMVRNMVQEVNARYLALDASEKPVGEPAGRLLIEGIGMQSHHNTDVSAAAIRATIDLFRPLGVKLSVSELDVLAQSWGAFDGSTTSTVTNNGLITQARLYREYMEVYIDNKDIIERISIWGVQDNHSWRSRARPLLFDEDGKAKPAYYGVLQALE